MHEPRPPRRHAAIAALLVAALVALGLAPVLAQPGPAQLAFGYSRLFLPLLRNSTPSTPPAVVQPRIVAWLDIPGQVRTGDRLAMIVNIKNEGSTDFAGRTEVIIPYDGKKFEAVDSSFDRGRGDWVHQNRYPTDLTVEFGPLRHGEFRRGIVYYQLRETQIGDKLRVRARFANGLPACGQAVCPTNERYVEVTDQFVSGGIGTLPPGSRQVQKLGDINYSEQRRWVPEGFRPGERVVTWLNSTAGGQRPLTLQQEADFQGKVYFSIDPRGLANGFYSIVAHGVDTKTEIVGEFRLVGSPIVSTSAAALQVLTPLPAPAPVQLAAEVAAAELAAAPAQATGRTTLTGAVAAAGTAGGTRLAGVQVNVIDADGNTVGATATDQFGGYVIGGLAPGSYRVRFDPHFALSAARRYQTSTQADVAVPASGTLRLDAELALGSSVSGAVTGTGVGGLEGVTVLLLSGGEVAAATSTAADGRYSFEGVPSGSYTLQFDPLTATDAGSRAFAAATLPQFAVTAPTPLSGKSATLSRSSATGEITGQVVAADTGAPLAAVFVVFERLNVTSGGYEYAGLALSDADGAYSGVLPPGSYRVAFRPGFSAERASAGYLGQYFTNGQQSPAQLSLVGGASLTADAALAPGATIAGTVGSAAGPLAGVAVLSTDSATGALVDIALTGEDGSYRSAGLPAGSYRVSFATYLTDDEATRGYAGTTRAEPLALASGARVAGVDATLSAGGAIAGTVTGAGASPLANVLVLVVDTRGTPANDDDSLAALALSDAGGAYTAPGLASGSYLVAFITELTGGPDVLAYFDEYYNDAATLAEADPVSVTAGATTRAIDAALSQGGQIRGRVTDGGSNVGLAGVLVAVYAPGDLTAPVAFAITDERGDYATSALAPGASYIVFFDPSFGGGAGAFVPEYYNDVATSGAAQPVSVPSTAPVTGIDAALSLAP